MAEYVLPEGAEFDGKSDYTDAVLAAVSRAHARPSGGTVLLPRGSTILLAPLEIKPGRKVTLQGEGFGASGGVAATTLARGPGVVGPLISSQGQSWTDRSMVTIRDLGIRDAVNGNTAPLVRLMRSTYSTLENVRISNTFGTGLDLQEAWECYLTTLILETCGSPDNPALHVRDFEGMESNSLYASGLQVQHSGGTDIRLAACSAAQFTNTKIEGKPIAATVDSPSRAPHIEMIDPGYVALANTFISCPGGRAPESSVRLVGPTGGQGVMFSNAYFAAQNLKSVPDRWYDMAAGAMFLSNVNMPSLAALESIRVQATVKPGRLHLSNVEGSPGRPLVNDQRKIKEFV